MNRFLLIFAVPAVLAGCGPRTLEPDAAYECERCADWNEPQDPFRIHGNTWYVGTDGLSSILIETSDGLILVDVTQADPRQMMRLMGKPGLRSVLEYHGKELPEDLL